jgi:hypothetical protein
MAENASIYQATQLGVEVTPGTPVAATKRITGANVTPSVQAEVNSFRPQGYKFTTVAALGKEWGEFSIDGPITYTELPYWLASLIKNVSPTGAGANRTWTFTPSVTAGDARATYTIEHGSAERARRFANCMVSGLTMTFTREEATFDGTILGAAMTDAFTLTGGTTALDLIPVLPTQVSIYLADTYAGLAGASALTRAFEATWAMTGLSSPVWPLNAAVSGFAAHVDTVPEATGSLVAATDATGMGLLTTLRNGATKFIRIEAVGAVLGTGNYKLTIDSAVKVRGLQDFRDQEGVYAVGFDFDITYDATWTKGTEIVLVTSNTAL